MFSRHKLYSQATQNLGGMTDSRSAQGYSPTLQASNYITHPHVLLIDDVIAERETLRRGNYSVCVGRKGCVHGQCTNVSAAVFGITTTENT